MKCSPQRFFFGHHLAAMLAGIVLASSGCGSEPTPVPGECLPADNAQSSVASAPKTAVIFWDASGSMDSNAASEHALIDSLDSRVLQNAGVSKIEHFLVGNGLTQVPTANKFKKVRNEWSSLHLAAMEAGRRLALREIGVAVFVSDLELAIDPALIKKGDYACDGVPMPSTPIAGAIFGRCFASGLRGGLTLPEPILPPESGAKSGSPPLRPDKRTSGDDSLPKPDPQVGPPPIQAMFVDAFRSGPGPLSEYPNRSLPPFATDVHVLVISLDPQLGQRVAEQLRDALPMRSEADSPSEDASAGAVFTETLIVDTSTGDLGASKCTWSGLGESAVSAYAAGGACAFDCMRGQSTISLICTVGDPLQGQPVAAWLPPSDVQLSVSDPERMHLLQPQLLSATVSTPASFGLEIGCGVGGTPAAAPLGACGTAPVIALSATLTELKAPTTRPRTLTSVSNSSNVQQVYRGLIDAVIEYLPTRSAIINLQLCDE